MMVVGGRAPGSNNGNANNNTLTVKGGTSFASNGGVNIDGGRVESGSGNANNNTVTIEGFTPGNGNTYSTRELPQAAEMPRATPSISPPATQITRILFTAGIPAKTVMPKEMP
jgi:hypothetical protein